MLFITVLLKIKSYNVKQYVYIFENFINNILLDTHAWLLQKWVDGEGYTDDVSTLAVKPKISQQYGILCEVNITFHEIYLLHKVQKANISIAG